MNKIRRKCNAIKCNNRKVWIDISIHIKSRICLKVYIYDIFPITGNIGLFIWELSEYKATVGLQPNKSTTTRLTLWLTLPSMSPPGSSSADMQFSHHLNFCCSNTFFFTKYMMALYLSNRVFKWRITKFTLYT